MERRKSQAPSGIHTHDLSVTRRVLYCCATAAALDIKRIEIQCFSNLFQVRFKSNVDDLGHVHLTPLPLDQLLLQKEDDGDSKLQLKDSLGLIFTHCGSQRLYPFL